MGLKRTVEPLQIAVDFEESVKQVELPSNDTAHSNHLQRLVRAAIADVERHTRRALITQTWRLSLSCFPCTRISLPRPPLQSVSSITYVASDGTVTPLASNLYQVSTDGSPGYVEPAYGQSWPTVRSETVDAVKITYVAGFGLTHGSVPAAYQNLIHELTAFRFMNRGDVESKLPDHIRWALQGLRCGAMYDYYGVKA